MPSKYQLTSQSLGPVLLYALLMTTTYGLEGDPSQKLETCGSQKNPNNNVVDLSDPVTPGPFCDLTTSELQKDVPDQQIYPVIHHSPPPTPLPQLRLFLEKDLQINASIELPPRINTSFIHSADLMLPPKVDVLKYLDTPGAKQPIRKARVVVSRGDKNPPVFEEYVCSPLPNVDNCSLLVWKSRRNPVGYILQESYGAKFTNCKQQKDCLSFQPSLVGSGLLQEAKRLLAWFTAAYSLPYSSSHMLDFAVLVDTTSSDHSQWFVAKLWYANVVYDSYQSLIDSYDCGRINKTKVTRPVDDENLFSSLKRRGKFQPPNPQRPPTVVEPDGKRYSVKDRKVNYLDWSFNFRLSVLTGPAVYDVRFKGQRIAYELGLNELSVFYSGHAASGQTTNYVDSGEYLGINSRALVPGGDCPETATLINSAFMSIKKREPEVYKAAQCLFEHNNGYPLRRHLAYRIEEGLFYGGMLDYVLTLRSALTIGNYDYIIDFIFHNNGVVETRWMSTGYIQTLFYATTERPYGFNIRQNILGNVHHHMAHFKVDLDVGGTSNRYETVDISEERVAMTAFPDLQYSQTRIKTNLKKTELEAVHDFNFNKPKYHVVHNNAKRTDTNEIKGYRIQMNCDSEQLVAEDFGNEKTVSWARHQMVVTRQKDDEISSSSIYGMHDSLQPTVDFTTFYSDNETIVDQDLVFWITAGLHHIPRSEDFPVTPTVGNQLNFLLHPFNYFPECPSMGSRDAIYVEHKDPDHHELGVNVERYVTKSLFKGYFQDRLPSERRSRSIDNCWTSVLCGCSALLFASWDVLYICFFSEKENACDIGFNTL
ncbi:unnamed protein product [Candidula unifasciata]|uniref:Amine oxidase n=1 Tax=Candidula unifasciata TaxID=100452 RepID=A0A8S3ZPU2_9EUPU|nr:unnamed protein product [Candidula unifasciata]